MKKNVAVDYDLAVAKVLADREARHGVEFLNPEVFLAEFPVA